MVCTVKFSHYDLVSVQLRKCLTGTDEGTTLSPEVVSGVPDVSELTNDRLGKDFRDETSSVNDLRLRHTGPLDFTI